MASWHIPKLPMVYSCHPIPLPDGLDLIREGDAVLDPVLRIQVIQRGLILLRGGKLLATVYTAVVLAMNQELLSPKLHLLQLEHQFCLPARVGTLYVCRVCGHLNA